MEALFIGTLAPSLDGWWHNLVNDGSGPTTYIQALKGDPNRWDKWGEIKRCNPLTAISPEFRKRLLIERDAARLDSRLLARFKSYRLNLPSGDESEVLLTVEDWTTIESRPVPERVGKPIVGVDLGGGRAWSSAVALWTNRRVEARAIAPGIPDLEEQERRDRVPSGQYGALFDSGQLDVAEGLRVQPPRMLWELIMSSWGKPKVIVCDRFRLAELQDATAGGMREGPMTEMGFAGFLLVLESTIAKLDRLPPEQRSTSGFLDHLEQEADDYIASENRRLVLQDEKVIRVLVAKVIERVKWLQSPD